MSGAAHADAKGARAVPTACRIILHLACVIGISHAWSQEGASAAPATGSGARAALPAWSAARYAKAQPLWPAAAVPAALATLPLERLDALRLGMGMDTVAGLLGHPHAYLKADNGAGQVWQYVVRDGAADRAFIASLWFDKTGLWLASGQSRPVGQLADLKFGTQLPPGAAMAGAGAPPSQPVPAALLAAAQEQPAQPPAVQMPAAAVTGPAAPIVVPVASPAGPANATAGTPADAAPAVAPAPAASPEPAAAVASAAAPPAPSAAPPSVPAPVAAPVPTPAPIPAPADTAMIAPPLVVYPASTPAAGALAAVDLPGVAAVARSPAAGIPGPGEMPALRQVLDDWLADWCRRDAAAYFAHYAASYVAPGKGREEWERTRRQRIEQARFIRVVAEQVQVRAADSARPQLVFTQDYASDRYKERSRKVLTLVKQDGRWLIEREENTPLTQ